MNWTDTDSQLFVSSKLRIFEELRCQSGLQAFGIQPDSLCTTQQKQFLTGRVLQNDWSLSVRLVAIFGCPSKFIRIEFLEPCLKKLKSKSLPSGIRVTEIQDPRRFFLKQILRRHKQVACGFLWHCGFSGRPIQRTGLRREHPKNGPPVAFFSDECQGLRGCGLPGHRPLRRLRLLRRGPGQLRPRRGSAGQEAWGARDAGNSP